MRYFIFTFLLLTGAVLATAVHAQEHYQSLVTIPKVSGSDPTTAGYITALYMLSVSVAAFLAVVKIIFGGVKYMLSEIVTDKESAKKDIMGALLGLLIVIGAAFILQTINPQLLGMDFLQNADGVTVTTESVPIPPPPNTQIGDPPLSLSTLGVTQEEIDHYIGTCVDPSGGVVNTSIDINNNVTYHCDEKPDEVATTGLECSGTTCICDYSQTGNRGTCRTKCITSLPTGMQFMDTTNLPNNRLSCRYFQTPPSGTTCTEFTIATCGVTDPNSCRPNPSEVCRVDIGPATTLYYGFVE